MHICISAGSCRGKEENINCKEKKKVGVRSDANNTDEGGDVCTPYAVNRGGENTGSRN